MKKGDVVEYQGPHPKYLGRVGEITSRHLPYGETERYAVDLYLFPTLTDPEDGVSVWEDEVESLWLEHPSQPE
jgi:hypothetical protein